MKTLWRFRARLLPALLFATVPLIFLAAIAWFRFMSAEPEAHQARAETIASFQALSAAAAVDQAVQDAERGQRGFLLTSGRESYLQPYLDSKARLPKLMAELQRALHDSPDQQTRLLSLQSNVTTKMNELESTIVTFRASGFDNALAIVLTDSGRNSMDTIHADLAAIVEAETARLANRQRDAAVAERRVSATFLVGGLAAAAALLVGAALLAGAYRRVAISELTLQSTLDSVREGVAAFDGGGRLRAWNTPFARLLDLAPAALRAASCWPSTAARRRRPPRSSTASAISTPRHGGQAGRRWWTTKAEKVSRSSCSTTGSPTAMSRPCSTSASSAVRKKRCARRRSWNRSAR